jgi:hypothetical protein
MLLLVFTAALVFSCSGKVGRPSDAINRMVKAYGGTEKIKALEVYRGKGFRRDLFSTTVTQSYPFDIYRKGEKYKIRTSYVTKGELVDATYIFHTEEYNYGYSRRDRKRDFERWDLALLKYRFPLVLGWAQGGDLGGELIDNGSTDGICKIAYEDEFNAIQIGIDTKTWLLNDIYVYDKQDSSRNFIERYSDYIVIDGVPFPARTKSTMNGMAHYDFFLVKIEFGIELPDSVFQISMEEIEEINNIKEIDRGKLTPE